MQWRVVEKKNKLLAFIFLLAVCGLLNAMIGFRASAQSVGGDSVIGATVCKESSSITLTQPVSDSVVTAAEITLTGSVDQAGQIEVRIDDAFDSTIPLSVGQTAFNATVQIASGTHTIKVTAINVCAGPDAEASAVVTYTAPPQAPSSGSETPTSVEGVTKPGDVPAVNESSNPTPLDRALQPLQGIASWLNIGVNDTTAGLSTMSVTRAVFATAGMTLVVVGISPVVIAQAASLPIISSVLPAAIPPGRIRLFSRGARGFGVLLTFGALFL